ncbi:MAG: glycoside hydrolase family 127 protein [Protaetiibacter sp.]
MSFGPIGLTTRGVIQPLRAAVQLADGPLGRYQSRTSAATIPHTIAMLEESGTLDNFRRLIGEADTPYRGMVFQDSDLYKTIEAVAWDLEHGGQPAVLAFYEDALRLIERVQRDDGYLNTYHQRPESPQRPWEDFADNHELYCLGHLIQAAVATHRAIGDDRLLSVAVRFVEHVIHEFGATGRTETCGHPEIETALVELYRTTGDVRHLRLAHTLVDRRGHSTLRGPHFAPGYYQDDVPVRDTAILRGHAVRALYLNAGVTDLVLEENDEGLALAMDAQWRDLVTRRMYITGGTGSRHRDESFGDAYELPCELAYAETCAGVALLQWSWRMFLLTGQAVHVDVFEQTLYNVVAAGMSSAGTEFFYSNPLQRRSDHAGQSQEAQGRRLAWYDCACCPPNLARTFASIGHYLLGVSGDGIVLANYAAGTAAVETSLGRVALRIDTAYPSDGEIRVTVVDGGSDSALLLRVPSWAGGYTVRATAPDGSPVEVPAADRQWIRIPGALRAGTAVELRFDMAPRAFVGHPRIDAIRETVSVMRGPVVYCLDQADNSVDIERLGVVTDAVRVAAPRGATELGPLLELPAQLSAPDDGLPLYSPAPGPRPQRSGALGTMRPYALWGNEGTAAMKVWMPRVEQAG